MDAKKLIEICRGKTVWIQTHNFPDPDAIGSAYALQELFLRNRIKSRLCHEGEIDKLSTIKMLTMLDIEIFPYKDIMDKMRPSDTIVLVDCQKNGGNTTDFIGDERAVIDHHPVCSDIEYVYSDIRITGACASMVAECFRETDTVPSVKAATALLYGMRMDTLQFSRGVTEFDIEMFSYLFKYADQRLLRRLETNNMEFEDLYSYGVAIEHIKLYGTVGFSYIDFECPDALVAILSDFLLSLVEVEVVIMYAKRKNGYKFSFRSELKDVNAGEIASEGLKEWGSGGGHSAMAGGFAQSDKLNIPEANFYEKVQEHFVTLIREKYPDLLK